MHSVYSTHWAGWDGWFCIMSRTLIKTDLTHLQRCSPCILLTWPNGMDCFESCPGHSLRDFLLIYRDAVDVCYSPSCLGCLCTLCMYLHCLCILKSCSWLRYIYSNQIPVIWLFVFFLYLIPQRAAVVFVVIYRHTDQRSNSWLDYLHSK